MKRPWVLLPSGPPGWRSHEQILPALELAWTRAGFALEHLHFPRPVLRPAWLKRLRADASAIVLPFGVGHYDSLWTLRELRQRHGVDLPCTFMVAADLTKGFRALFDYRTTLSPGDRIVTNCEAERELVHQAFGGALGTSIPARAIALPLKERPRAAGAGERRQLKRALGVAADDFLIVYAGRISVQKNIHGLLASFAALKRHCPRARLHVLGSMDELRIPHFKAQLRGRYLHELGALMQRLGLGDEVRFTGSLDQPELMRYLRACDAHVTATLHSGEDFGYSIAQGLASGAPTIVTDWGGGRDFVAGGAAIGIPVSVSRNGPRTDLARLTAELRRLHDDPATARALRREALAFARARLGVATLARAWRNVVASPGRGAGAPPASKLTIAPIFLETYLRHQSELAANAQAAFRFEGPTDPLYLTITSIYAGQPTRPAPDPAQRFVLHPLFDLGTGYLADPIAPTQLIKLSAADRRQISRAIGRRGATARQLSRFKWFKRLRDLGIVLPTTARACPRLRSA